MFIIRKGASETNDLLILDDQIQRHTGIEGAHIISCSVFTTPRHVHLKMKKHFNFGSPFLIS